MLVLVVVVVVVVDRKILWEKCLNHVYTVHCIHSS